jgi:UDP-N-acetylmuramoyl-L-alanyl-D-glutamate--2,6-diaminopimelate ligase
MGERLWPAGPIPPCALEVQAALAAMVGAGCQACVIETGPPAAAAKHLAGVDFDLVIHTDGLDCAGWDRPRPVPAASRLARRPNLDLKERDNSKTANIDIDVVFGTRATRTTELTVQLAHGDPTPLLLRAVQLVLDQHGACCSVKLPGRWGVCRLSPPSRSALARLLGAAAAALRLGVPEARVAGFLIQPRPVPGRLERIDAGQPYAVFVDRAETPESLECALRELRAVTPGRLRVMIGCAGTTDLAFRREMGRIAAELADHTIVTSHNPGSASPLQIAADMASGTQAGSRNVDIVIDRSQAIRRAMRLAAPGDTVLLAGKGHETFQFENHTIVPFDDRRLARQALEDWGWS